VQKVIRLMSNQGIWIGIVIAAFFVGLGSTYLIFHTGSSDVNEDFNVIEESSMMSSMQFNTGAPLTIPMIDGYYNGEKVYFIHTEISDKDIADMMSTMVNFPTLYVPDLDDISPDDLGKVYIFTNGITGSGPYGGGPFFFQIDIFDSVPGMNEYHQFRVPQLVTWNEDSNPILLTSIQDLFEAEANGELSIESTNFVVNAPIIVWTSDGTTQTASMIQNMFESMSGVEGELTFVDKNNYVAIFKLHSEKDMGMMEMSP